VTVLFYENTQRLAPYRCRTLDILSENNFKVTDKLWVLLPHFYSPLGRMGLAVRFIGCCVYFI